MNKKENELVGWFNAFDASRELAQQDDEAWRLEIGKPSLVLDIDGGQLGFWRTESGCVMTARLVKDKAVRSSAQLYTKDFIAALAQVKG